MYMTYKANDASLSPGSYEGPIFGWRGGDARSTGGNISKQKGIFFSILLTSFSSSLYHLRISQKDKAISCAIPRIFSAGQFLKASQ